MVIQLAAYYGLRRSEVLGIRWSAIDDEKGTLSINHKVTEGVVDGRHQIYTEDRLKTKSSFRTLPLIPAVRALLDEQQARQEEYPAAVQEALLYRLPGLRVYRRERVLDEARLCAYLLERWQGCPDMLTVHQASELCGYSRSALHHWLDAGKIEGLNYRGATLLSKESLACWLASPGGQNIAALSEQHLAWMKDFQAVKQNSGIGPGPMPL